MRDFKFMKKKTDNLLKQQIFLFISEALPMYHFFKV